MAKKTGPIKTMYPGESLTGREYIEKKTQAQKTREALRKIKKKK